MGHEGVVCAPISTLRITAEITAALLITCEVFTSQYLSGIGGAPEAIIGLICSQCSMTHMALAYEPVSSGRQPIHTWPIPVDLPQAPSIQDVPLILCEMALQDSGADKAAQCCDALGGRSFTQGVLTLQGPEQGIPEQIHEPLEHLHTLS